MNCDQCKLLDLPVKQFLYEDDKAFAYLAPQPAVPGHILVAPKQHVPILENISDELAEHVFLVANTLSMALFDGLHAHGTNILVCNGIAAGQESAHFMVHVIPRFPDDGLGFAWLPRQLTEEQMATIELQLKEECAKINGTPREEALKELQDVEETGRQKEDGTDEAEKAKARSAAGEGKKDQESEPDGDYMIRHVTRIP